MRIRAALAALVLAAAALLGAGAPASSDPDPAPPTAAVHLAGLDLHDGMAYESDGTFYLVGSAYGCGYAWYVASPWCGFKVSTAPSLDGPWSTPQLLFPPAELDPLTGKTFASECGTNDGHGCFNPRMIERGDGVYVLWFNEVNGRTSTSTHAYWVMGCNGPTGPCGASAGAPHGSTHKPALHQCAGNNGDFALVTDTAGAAIICSYGGTLAEERLDYWWTNGSGNGSTSLGGLANVEGVGAFQDPSSGTWVMTYSDVACGFCTGTGTGYATAPSLMGPWTAPGTVGWSAPAGGRRDVSASSCGGQPRTISMLDGRPYQGIDLWTTTAAGAASRNQTAAGLVLAPLTYTPTAGSTGDGFWVPPLALAC